MMPKGVEHPYAMRSDALMCRVKIPMMPKGVEHRMCTPPERSRVGVKIPMMPKGVEHMSLTTEMRAPDEGEDSNDAERR